MAIVVNDRHGQILAIVKIVQRRHKHVVPRLLIRRHLPGNRGQHPKGPGYFVHRRQWSRRQRRRGGSLHGRAKRVQTPKRTAEQAEAWRRAGDRGALHKGRHEDLPLPEPGDRGAIPRSDQPWRRVALLFEADEQRGMRPDVGIFVRVRAHPHDPARLMRTFHNVLAFRSAGEPPKRYRICAILACEQINELAHVVHGNVPFHGKL